MAIARPAGTRVITFEQAVEAGCAYFGGHGNLEIEEVATALSVSRATLYRVVGSRDHLLGAVLWQMARRTLDRARARRSREGIDGVTEVVRHFARATLASRSLRDFIAAEPQAATRVLAAPDGGVHRHAVAAATRLFAEVELPLVEDPEQVAYLLVRIVESLCFAEVSGTRPDLDLAEQTIRAMLVRACTPRQTRAARLIDAAMCVALTWLPVTEGALPVAA